MNSTNLQYFTNKESNLIKVAKGFAILLVLMIHTDIRELLVSPPLKGSFLDVYLQLINRLLVDTAVPIFFFLSGFLFSLSNKSLYIKIKKRCKTILVPYLLWCCWGFFIPFFLQRVLNLEYLFAGNLKLISQFVYIDYIRIFWDIRDGAPILSTLWFLRNLIVMILLTPLFTYIIKTLNKAYLAVVFLLYFFGEFWITGIDSGSIFYFTVGMYFSINRINPLNLFSKMNLYCLIPLWLLFIIFGIYVYCNFEFYDKYMLIFRPINLIVIIALLNKYICKLDSYTGIIFKISSASFFIYLFHEPWLGYAMGAFFKLYQPSSCVLIMILPITFFIVAICYSYLAYNLLSKYFPKFYMIITGARS